MVCVFASPAYRLTPNMLEVPGMGASGYLYRTSVLRWYKKCYKSVVKY